MASKASLDKPKLVMTLAAITAIALSGCTGLSSPRSWFSSNASSTPPTSSLTSNANGFTSQLKSMGTTVSSAMTKAKNVVTAPFSAKDPDSAVDPETSLANMPNSLTSELWVTQGQAAELKGNFPAALDNYTKALQQEPNNLPALQSTARLYTRQEQHATAVEWHQRVVAVSPTAANYAELADSQLKSGNANAAQVSIQKAISLEPSVPRYRNNLAGMLVATGRSDEAVRQLEQIFPAAVANYNVAYLHYTNKNMAAAQQHLNLALQADPNLKQARDLMATLTNNQPVQAARAAYNTAESIYRTAQATFPSTAQASSEPNSTQTTSTVNLSSATPTHHSTQAIPATYSFQTLSAPAQQPNPPANSTGPAIPTVPQFPPLPQ